MSLGRITIRQSALPRIELKEAHSTLSGPVLVRYASGRWSVWLAGMILVASIFLSTSDSIDALAAEKEPSHSTINVSVHEGLLTLQAVDAPLTEVLEGIGETALHGLPPSCAIVPSMRAVFYGVGGKLELQLLASKRLSGSPPATTAIPPIAEDRRPMVRFRRFPSA